MKSSDLRITQVRLHLTDLVLSEFLLSVRRADRGRDDNVFAHLPVYWRGYTLLVTGLEAVNHSENLCGIPASTGWVHLRKRGVSGANG
jgi:hypothetical protein